MEIRYTSAAQWVDARDGVIPAPYALEAGESITDRYLEPVVFHNENGPDIGVTTCGVIVRNGLYFKDMDNSGELAPYKDWRLSPEERAKDMVAHLRLDQKAGLVLNTLFNTPVAPTHAEAAGADGKLEMSKIYKHHDPDEKPIPGPLPGMTMSIDDADVLDKHITAGVYRGDMHCEAGMVALYHNAGTQMLEYEACKGGVAIPYSLHTNPINIGYPDSLGIGAAVLGDGNADFVYEMADTDRKMMKAEGLHIMYGPQVDVATDPRWPRTNGTYGERTDVTSDITESPHQGLPERRRRPERGFGRPDGQALPRRCPLRERLRAACAHRSVAHLPHPRLDGKVPSAPVPARLRPQGILHHAGLLPHRRRWPRRAPDLPGRGDQHRGGTQRIQQGAAHLPGPQQDGL